MGKCNFEAPNGEKSLLHAGLSQFLGEQQATIAWYKLKSMTVTGEEPTVEEGLKQQWKNRAKCLFENPWSAQMIEQLRTSTYQLQVLEVFGKNFKEPLGKFMHNSIERGEIDQMPFETYWSIAFAPLYNLIRFHNEGQSLGGKPFVLTDEILWKTFELVIKALKK